jgi:hypothetical protein
MPPAPKPVRASLCRTASASNLHQKKEITVVTPKTAPHIRRYADSWKVMYLAARKDKGEEAATKIILANFNGQLAYDILEMLDHDFKSDK